MQRSHTPLSPTIGRLGAVLKLGLLAPLLSLASTGCHAVDAFHPRFVDPPTLKVERVEVLERGPEGVRLRVHAVASNPNKLAFPLLEASYRVGFENGPERRFSEKVHVTLPPETEQAFTLTAATPSPPPGASWVVSGSVAYHPPGGLRRFLTESSVPLPSVAFSGRGALENAGPAASDSALSGVLE